MGTSSVTTMQEMFREATAFNQPLSFDTSSVAVMYKMFENAAVFNQPLSLDTSSVTNMHGIFTNTPLSDVTSSSSVAHGLATPGLSVNMVRLGPRAHAESGWLLRLPMPTCLCTGAV